MVEFRGRRSEAEGTGARNAAPSGPLQRFVTFHGFDILFPLVRFYIY